MLKPVCYRSFPRCDSLQQESITQYKLKSSPSSLKSFTDLFEEDTLRYIWVTDSSFVRLIGCSQVRRMDDSDPNNYQSAFARLLLLSENSDGKVSIKSIVEICALNVSEAKKAVWKCLCETPDTHFVDIFIHWTQFDAQDALAPCPFEVDFLTRLTSFSQRTTGLSGMELRPAQSRALVTEGGSLQLHACKMSDGGAAFLSALEKGTQLSCLGTWGRLPFDEEVLEGNFVPQIRSISLNASTRIPSSFYSWLWKAQDLELYKCTLDGTAFIDALSQQNALRFLRLQGLSLSSDPGSRNPTIQMVFESLRGNKVLEKLDVGGDHWLKSVDVTSLAEALPDITMLRHFSLNKASLSLPLWARVLDAVASHPSLTSIVLPTFSLGSDNLTLPHDVAVCVTRLVAQLLEKNERIEELKFFDSMGNEQAYVSQSFDLDTWRAEVVPQLEYNQYRYKFSSLRTSLNRAAVLGKGLSRVASKPNLVWILIKMNQDLLASRLEAARPKVSGKR